jgi:hypothetical protein
MPSETPVETKLRVNITKEAKEHEAKGPTWPLSPLRTHKAKTVQAVEALI